MQRAVWQQDNAFGMSRIVLSAKFHGQISKTRKKANRTLIQPKKMQDSLKRLESKKLIPAMLGGNFLKIANGSAIKEKLYV